MRCLGYLTVVALCASSPSVCHADDRVTIRYVEMLESQSYDALIGFCDERIKASPNDTMAYYFRGIAYRRTCDFDSAMKDFLSMVRLEPQSGTAHVQIGITILDKSGFFDVKPTDRAEAIRNFTKAIEIDPNHADAYLQRANCYELCRPKSWEPLTQEEVTKILADYNQVLKLRPRDSDVHERRAWVYERQGEHDRALAGYTEAIRINPREGFYRAKRGELYGKKKQYRLAIADLEEGFRSSRSDFKSTLTLAWLLATCPDAKYRNGKRAVELADRECIMHPNYRAWECLAAAYAEIGDFDQAVRSQKKAIGEVKDVSVLAGPGRVYECLRLYQARKPYREAP